jgi:hypothetical protein
MRRLAVIMSLLAGACGSKAPPPAAKPVAHVETKPVETKPAKAYDERLAALDQLDPADPRSIDAAIRAASGLGADRAPAGIHALIKAAQMDTNAKLIAVQVASIRALGKYPPSDEIVTTLGMLLARQMPKEPEPDPDADTGTAMAFASTEQRALVLAVKGAAVNALGDLRSPQAVTALVSQMYESPELLLQLRRALVSIGPSAEQELLKVLRGENADVDKTAKAAHLSRDFYAAVAIGDFHDPASVQALLAALKRPPVPAYYDGDQPSANTQYHAILDALHKLGTADAAAPVYELWNKNRDPHVATPAIAAYAFLTRDSAGLDELGKIAADNTADDSLRQEAATAFARLAHDETSIALMQSLAKRYLDASAKKRKEAEPKRKAADAADKAFAPKKKALEEAKAKALAVTRDPKKTVADIKTAVNEAKKAEDEFKTAKKKHREQVMPYKQLDNAATAYLGYARMFQAHIARIEIAIRCKQDLACFAGTLKANEASAAASVKKWIPDVARWKPDEKRELLAAQVDRAMVEIGKQGAKASDQTEALLDAASSEQPLVREAVLLALPKIAPTPCPSCAGKLDDAIRAAGKKDSLAQLQMETELVRAYFR